MKKHLKIIVISLGIIGLVLLLTLKIYNENTSTTIFTLNDIKSIYDISYTIDTPRSAVEYLKMMKKFNVKELEDIETQAKTNIVITVKEKDNKGIKNWSILIATKNTIPSFSCKYVVSMFPSKKDKVTLKECGWNK